MALQKIDVHKRGNDFATPDSGKKVRKMTCELGDVSLATVMQKVVHRQKVTTVVCITKGATPWTPIATIVHMEKLRQRCLGFC